MSDQEQGNRNGTGQRTGGGRRRRRRKGGGGGQPENSGNQRPQSGNSGGGGGGRDGDPNRRRRRRRRPGGSGNASGGDGPRRPPRPIEPFELFSVYHLGLDESRGYRNIGIREVAKRFGCGQNDIRNALDAYSMDRDSMRKIRRAFDVALAELDIKVAPEGIDRGVVARERYEEFVEAGLAGGLFDVEPSLALLTPPDESDNTPGEDPENAEAPEESDQEVETNAEEEEA